MNAGWIVMGLVFLCLVIFVLVMWSLPKPVCKACRKRIDAFWLPDNLCSGCYELQKRMRVHQSGFIMGDGYDDD